MSSSRRPWFPWYPRDFNQDEKVRMLSDDAELVYRRALDVLWQANALQMPSNRLKLAQALARGWNAERFEKAWLEIQTEDYELLKTTKNGLWVYSERLKREAEKIESICNIRRKAAKKGGKASAQAKGQAKGQPKGQPKGQANVNQTSTHTHTHTDVIDLSKDKSRVARFSSNHFSEKTGSHFEAILSTCQQINSLPRKKSPFNVYQWVQKWANKNGHPGAILESLRGLIVYWPDAEKPFAYADTIMRTKNGNFNEREAIEQSEIFKADWKASESVAKLLKGIG